MTACAVAIVSDSHLSPSAPDADANWDAVVRHIEATAPDLVLHVGDLALKGEHDPDDLRHGRRQLDRLGAVWRAVPGNHDIGDNPSASTPADAVVDEDRRQRWVDIIGPDRWTLELNGWTFIALNAELFGSGLDSEATQWTWLEERVNATPADRPTAIVSHKPLVTSDTELAAAPPYRFVPAAPAQRLRDLLGDRAIRLVISGHVHQYRVLQFDGTTHVWAPSTWAVLPEAIQPTFGAKRCGMLSLTLHDDGRFEQRLVEPVGLAQQTVGEDIPNPYGH